jgi:ubiquinol-cytochrome c reductase cytochrome b subunit
MFTAIPFIGDGLMQMILGGPSAGTPTLTRFYAFHFVIPFVILFFVFAHIWALRVALAKKPLDPLHYEDREVVPFYPYHTFKGLFWLAVFLCIYMVFTFFFPEALSPAGHFIPFDPLNMPEQILPEWYLLPFYGMLKAITFGINIYIAAGMAFLATAVVAACREKIFRAGKFSALILSGIFLCLLGYAGQINTGAGSGFLNLPLAGFFLISAKSAGVLAMFGIFIVLFLLPWLDTHKTRNGIKRPVFRLTLAGFVISVIALGVSGAMPPEPLWAAIGLAGAAYYYAWFLITLPLLSRFEKIES